MNVPYVKPAVPKRTPRLHDGWGRPIPSQPGKIVGEDDWNDIMKVLTWVHDNPGCHPENIRKELERLYQQHIGV